MRLLRTRFVQVSRDPILRSQALSSTLWDLPSVPCRATKEHEGNGKFVVIEAPTPGTPPVTQEPHWVTDLVSKGSTRVARPCQPRPWVSVKRARCFGCHHNWGLKVLYILQCMVQ